MEDRNGFRVIEPTEETLKDRLGDPSVSAEEKGEILDTLYPNVTDENE